jgi:Kef-type K+ transport system membrane component KefB
MPHVDYLNVLGLALVSLSAPLLGERVRLPLPEAVVQTVGGVVLGPSFLGWIHLDGGVTVLSSLALAYLLFVSGMEIEPRTLLGPTLLLGLGSLAASSLLAVAAATALKAAGVVEQSGLMVAVLLTTSLGVVMAVLKRTGEERAPLGQVTLLSAAVADIASVALLCAIFGAGAGVVRVIVPLALFAAAAAAPRRDDVQRKLNAIGFGVLAPLFFVASGLQIDLGALVRNPSALAVVPLVFVAMASCRILPVLVFRGLLDLRRSLAAGLLLSSKLTFVAAAVAIGRSAGALDPATASALMAAAVLTVLLFPAAATSLLVRSA